MKLRFLHHTLVLVALAVAYSTVHAGPVPVLEKEVHQPESESWKFKLALPS